MPEFTYKAARKDGSIAQGSLSAATQEAALRQLRSQGLTPVRLQPGAGTAAGAAKVARQPAATARAASLRTITRTAAAKIDASQPDAQASEALLSQAVTPQALATQALATQALTTQALTADLQTQTIPVAKATAPAAGSGAAKPFWRRSDGGAVKREEVLAMTSELAVLLRAGLPIDRALRVQIDMSSKASYTALLRHLLETVKSGKSISHGLEAYPQLFGGFYINMVRSGEASGRLAEVLARLTEYLERSREVRGTVVSALIYPVILAVVAVLSIAVMLGFVVPQFEALFADMGDALPALTRAVIALGDGIKAYGWLMLIVLVLGGYGIRRWLRQPAGQSWKDRTLLSLPLFGPVLFKYEVARFARTMGTLLGNGVSMLQAINIALSTVENGIVRQSFQILPPAVKAGQRMSEALAESGDFTPMVIQMVRVGEESGRLDEMLLELARVYEHDVQAGIKRGLTLLEPLLILGMGGMIALIIISILMGILSVNDLAM